MMDAYTSNREPYDGVGPLENREKEIKYPIAKDTWTATEDGSVVGVYIHDGDSWNEF